jgi:alpha-glucosidase
MKTSFAYAVARRLEVLVLFAGLLLAGSLPVVAGENLKPRPMSLFSPDGRIQVVVNTRGELNYLVNVDGVTLVNPSRLGLKLRGAPELGGKVGLLDYERHRHNGKWENPLGKNRVVRDYYRELCLKFQEAGDSNQVFEVCFRAYNDGVAFRYLLSTNRGGAGFVLEQDLSEFTFARDYPCWAGQQENGFKGAQEWEFKPQHLSDIKASSVIGLPLLVQGVSNWVAVTESDLRDWSGLWLGGAGSPSNGPVRLVSKLAPRLDGDGLVKASAPHASPWRVLMIGDQPGRLVESDLVLNLAAPCDLTNSAWIKPGMMAWDHWWSGDVQMDTETLKEYIQLAADMGWPYQLIDWKWYGEYNTTNSCITNVNPAVDMAEVLGFAREKGVRLWVWLYWTDVDRQDAYKEAFAVYEKWGLAGVKIDFMDRDDQEMVNWYEKITRAAADHHLMVDFHGAYKGTGLNRTLPNQMTREGVLGNEYNRWSARVTPEHKVTLPFTRFLAGPGDFTPGGFLNRNPKAFRPDPKAAQVQGTRAAELALFVAYESPICCVCDHPEHYRNQAGADFLQIVPTVWDETRVLDGAVGQYLAIARRSGKRWFMGVLSDSNSRTVQVSMDFLGRGAWQGRIWKDGPGSDIDAQRVELEQRVARRGDTVDFWLAPGGGAAAVFEQAE